MIVSSPAPKRTIPAAGQDMGVAHPDLDKRTVAWDSIKHYLPGMGAVSGASQVCCGNRNKRQILPVVDIQTSAQVLLIKKFAV
jgi:hypothetical protein